MSSCQHALCVATPVTGLSHFACTADLRHPYIQCLAQLALRITAYATGSGSICVIVG
jgi:hypothetical protein